MMLPCASVGRVVNADDDDDDDVMMMLDSLCCLAGSGMSVLDDNCDEIDSSDDDRDACICVVFLWLDLRWTELATSGSRCCCVAARKRGIANPIGSVR